MKKENRELGLQSRAQKKAADAVALRARGWSPWMIAKELRISTAYVYRLLQDNPDLLEEEQAKRNAKKAENVVRMYQTVSEPTNDTVLSIAEDQEIAPIDVRRFLTEAGLFVPQPEPPVKKESAYDADIATLIKEGLTVGAISARLGLSTARIYAIMREKGLKVPSKHKERVAYALALYNEGKSVREIATLLRIVYTNVYPLLYEAGVDVSKNREAAQVSFEQRVIELYFGEIKMKQSEVARALNTSEQRIYPIIQRETDRRKGASIIAEIDELFPDPVRQKSITAEIDELYPDPPELGPIGDINETTGEDENNMRVL